MCPVMIITIYFEADHKKMVSSQKSSIFGPQSSLRIWRSCHPIESGPSEPKKWGFHRCSVKKRRIWVKNELFWPKIHFFWNFPTLFVTIMTGHQKDNIFVLTPLHGCSQKNGFGPKNSFFGPQKGHFGQSGPRNGPPNGHLPENRRYPEFPEDIEELSSHWVGTVRAKKRWVS